MTRHHNTKVKDIEISKTSFSNKKIFLTAETETASNEFDLVWSGSIGGRKQMKHKCSEYKNKEKTDIVINDETPGNFKHAWAAGL